MNELQFSKEGQHHINTLLGQYPNAMAVCLPALHLAQKEFGAISAAVEELVAKTLKLPMAHVHGVATFYSMYNQQQIGQYHLQVCTNVSCLLVGGVDLLHHLEEKLHIKPGETTEDGLFTLSEVECLAYCGTGPVMQINEVVHEQLTTDKIDQLLENLRQENRKAHV